MIQFNSKKNLKVDPLSFEKFLIELKGKLGQSSVNGLLNNSSSVNLCQTLRKLTVKIKSVQSTSSHLISTSVPAFSWSTDHFNTIYIEQTDLGVVF